ncbi:MAG: hypothetical protein INQ03_15050 [Candidatus Heimdallarchaeota archaeon]|nr:hypothetical protein [Candidatus Heimdallarchaeota archaeon]
MSTVDLEPHTYLHLVVEVKLNNTERRESLEEILHKFLPGEIVVDERIDGRFLLIRAEGTENMQILHDWIASQRIIDTVRSRLIKSIVGNVTAVYFNRQAAYMNHLSLLDLEDGTPLGPINYQLISDNLFEIIDMITPQTIDGRIMTEEEKVKHLARIENKKERKRKEREREQQRDEKYLNE